MPVELLNPDGLPKPDVYRQVAVATGSRTVFLAGQVARTEAGEPVGVGDFAAQVEQAYLNVATALAAVGGSFDDFAKLTLRSGLERREDGRARRRRRARRRTSASRPDQARHAHPGRSSERADLLIEVDAIAVLQ